MLHKVKVEPVNDGWLMRNGAAAPLKFDTRDQALWSAGKVGESVAEAGLPAEIEVVDRAGHVAGRFIYAPARHDLELAD